MFSLFINNLFKTPNKHADYSSDIPVRLGVPYSIESTGMSYLTVLTYKNLEVLNIFIFNNRKK